jgi:uncharacterized membrane protein YccF (DUF307 family)
MRFWFLVTGGWLVFSGVLFVSLVFALGVPILPAVGASVALTGLLLWLWSRDIEAKPLTMNESLWNTPEEEEEDVKAR